MDPPGYPRYVRSNSWNVGFINRMLNVGSEEEWITKEKDWGVPVLYLVGVGG